MPGQSTDRTANGEGATAADFNDDGRVDGAQLNVRSDHNLAATFLSYHNETVSSVEL
jgi:hypothetical protein